LNGQNGFLSWRNKSTYFNRKFDLTSKLSWFFLRLSLELQNLRVPRWNFPNLVRAFSIEGMGDFLRCVLFFFASNLVVAQIQFTPTFLRSDFQLDQWYSLGGDDSVQVTTFKFYVSNVQCQGRSISVNALDNVFLLDVADSSSLSIPTSRIEKEADFTFHLGMDSSLNTCGFLEGPFDPLLGMYWAWNTGYIQLKIAGSGRFGGVPIPFEYHIGGYQHPNAACEKVGVEVGNEPIQIDMHRFLKSLPYASEPRIMHPCPTAKRIHQNFATCFH
jgi:hypothetical protein